MARYSSVSVASPTTARKACPPFTVRSPGEPFGTYQVGRGRLAGAAVARIRRTGEPKGPMALSALPARRDHSYREGERGHQEDTWLKRTAVGAVSRKDPVCAVSCEDGVNRPLRGSSASGDGSGYTEIRRNHESELLDSPCQPRLDSVLARASHPVQQLGTATHARCGHPRRISTYALNCTFDTEQGRTDSSGRRSHGSVPVACPTAQSEAVCSGHARTRRVGPELQRPEAKLGLIFMSSWRNKVGPQ